MILQIEVNKLFLLKFLKFGVVGASGVFVDFAITWLCKEKFKLHKYLANTLGFITAASTNWWLNRWWTFQSENPNYMEEYINFILVSIVGLGINTFFLWILNDKVKLNFYVAKLGAIAITTLWNFFANYLYTFA